MSTVHLKREQILALYDTRQKDGGFATALSALAGEELAIALLERCLIQQGKKVTRLESIPTTGKSSGPRLDAWLEIDGQLAQVEVKNWGANAIGGKVYTGDVTIGWQQFLAWFKRNHGLRKVLHPMKPPTSYTNRKVELALVCMWPVMHISGGTDSYFSVDVQAHLPALEFETPFTELHVFSMSAYLHSLQDDVLELDMPRTYARLKKMATILGINGDSLNATK